MGGGAFARFNDDDFRWWITRQLDAVDLDGVYRTLTLRDRSGTNAWLAAREARHETSGYIADLEAITRAVSAIPASSKAFAHSAAFTFLQRLLGEMSARVGPELASTLVAGGVWTLEQASAWARRSHDEHGTLLIIDALLPRVDGTLRDQLLADAVSAADRIVDESGPPRLARIAAHAGPHVQAQLLMAMHDMRDKGGLALGLDEMMPVLDPELFDLARDTALLLPSLGERLGALLLIAEAHPREEADAAYAEIFELLNAEDEWNSSSFGDAIEMLARDLPDDRLDALDPIVNVLPKSSRAALLAAATVEGRRLRPDKAIAIAESVADYKARITIRALAARRYADDGDTGSALEAWNLNGVPPPSAHDVYGTLAYIVERVNDVEDQRLLATLGALDAQELIPVLRSLASRASGPAPKLRSFASGHEGRVRSRAMAAVAGCLEPFDIDEVLGSILEANFIDIEALGDLASHLDGGQAVRAVRQITAADSFVGLDGKGTGRLIARIAQVVGVDRALEALAALPTSVRGGALTPILDWISGDLLPGVLQNVIQPEPLLNARINACVALAGALPTEKVEALVEQAAALDRPADRANALAKLAVLGESAAQVPLANALATLFSQGQREASSLGLCLLHSSAAGCSDLVPRLIEVVHKLAFPLARAVAYLNLSRLECSEAAERAARLLIEELLTHPMIHLPARGGWIDAEGHKVNWPTAPDPTSLVAAVATALVGKEWEVAMVVSKLAPFLGRQGRLEIAQSIKGLGQRARMLASAALADLEPAVAASLAADGLTTIGPFPNDSGERILWLDYVGAANLDPGPDVVASAWADVLALDPVVLPGRLSSLVALRFRPDDRTITEAVMKVLQSDAPDFADTVVTLAPLLGREDLRRLLNGLRLRSEGNWRAAIAGAGRAGELGEDDLAIAFCDLPDSDWWSLSFACGQADADGCLVRSAVSRLSEAALRRVFEHASDRSSAAEVIVLGATVGGHEALVRALLPEVPQGTTRDKLLDRVVMDAQISWESWLVQILKNCHAPNAMAEFAARLPRARGIDLLVDALQVARPRDRAKIVAAQYELAVAIPVDRLWSLWQRSMEETDSREDVLGSIEAWAGVLIAVLGPEIAIALDDVIALVATDMWPAAARELKSARG